MMKINHLKTTKNIILILMFIIFQISFYPCFGQTKNIIDFSFKDTYGNKFQISNIERLPIPLDTVFLKLNLTGVYFDKTLADTTTPFDFVITDIKTIKKGKKFEITLTMRSLESDIEETLKHFNICHYSMTIKYIDKKPHIDKIKWLFGEI